MSSSPAIISIAEEKVEKFYQHHTEIKASHGWEHIRSVLDHTNKALLSLENDKHNSSSCNGVSLNSTMTNDHSLAPHIQTEIKLAALLHDVDDRKYFPNTPRGEYPNATKILHELGFKTSSQETINQIIKMISWVSCSENGNEVPDEVRAKNAYHLLIPRWADRLCAVGKKGVIRCYQYTQESGRPLSTQASPRPTNEEEIWSKYALPSKLDEYMQRGGTSTDMISHYYDKLFHIAKPPSDIVRNPYLEREAESLSRELVEVCLRYGKTGKVDEEYIMKLILEEETK